MKIITIVNNSRAAFPVVVQVKAGVAPPTTGPTIAVDLHGPASPNDYDRRQAPAEQSARRAPARIAKYGQAQFIFVMKASRDVPVDRS